VIITSTPDPDATRADLELADRAAEAAVADRNVGGGEAARLAESGSGRDPAAALSERLVSVGSGLNFIKRILRIYFSAEKVMG
jgi:hypothetical protein